MDTRDEIQSLRNMYTKLLRPEADNIGSSSKSGSTIKNRPIADTPVAESKSVGREAQTNKQILKLKMRLQNQQQANSVPNEEVKSFFNYTNNPPQSPGVSKDIALMIQEKKYWLSRIQDDNFNLLSLLKSIQNAKLKLINQIDELELERDSLRSLLLNASLPAVQAVFDALVAGSPMDESLLPPLLSATMMRLKSHCAALGQGRSGDGSSSWQRDEDIRQQLFRLLLRCLSNQFELLLNLQQRAEKIVQLTIDGYRIPRQEEAYGEVDAELDALRSIAEAGPNSTQATDALANSGLFHTIAAGLLDKAVSASGKEMIKGVVLPRYSQSRQLRTPAATATATATAASPPASASASTPTLSAEVAALVAQNEELKASLLQMRKRNAQLRTNMAAGQVTTGGPNASQRRGSVSQQRRSGSPIPATALDRSSGDQWADEDDHDNYEGKKSAPVVEEAASGEAGPETNAEGGGGGVSAARSDLPPSDSLLGTFFDAQLKSRCAVLVEARAHPLCAGVGEDLLPSIAATLAAALRPTAEPVFVAQLQRNLKESFSKEDSAGALPGKQQVQLSIQDVGVGWQRAFNRFARFEDADEDLQAAAFAAAEQCMEDPSVQNELGATLSLYLTYIHTSRKLVVAASFPPERVERRPAPAAPSMPADSTPAIPNPNPNLRSGKTDEVARRPAPAAPSMPSDSNTTTAAAISDNLPPPPPPPAPAPSDSGTKTKKGTKSKTSSKKASLSQSFDNDKDDPVHGAAEGKAAAENVSEGASVAKSKAKSKKADKDATTASTPPPPSPSIPAPSAATAAGGGEDSPTRQLQETFKIPKTTKKKVGPISDS